MLASPAWREFRQIIYLQLESRRGIEPSHFFANCLTVSVGYVPSASGEPDYDYDNTDGQSQKHKQGGSAEGSAFIECIVTKH